MAATAMPTANAAKATSKTTRATTIDVGDFVALDDIDPIYYDHTYWLAPDGETADRPYRLLLATMEDRQRVGIGTVVMRNKQYLGAVRPLAKRTAKKISAKRSSTSKRKSA